MECSVGLPSVESPHRAAVVACEPTDSPVDGVPAVLATIAFPAMNVGRSLPQFLSTVMGEVFDTGPAAALRLVDVNVPEWLPGPRFPAPGAVLLGAILKPSTALSPEEAGALATELAAGDIDVVKDDETMASPPHSPVVERVRSVRAAAPGLLYMANVTGPLDSLIERAWACADAGANGLMLSWATSGLDALRWLRESGPPLPLHAHPNFAAAFTRSTHFGVAPEVVARLTAAAGGDQVHCGSVAGRLWGSRHDVVALFHAVRAAGACPVIAGGEGPHTVPATAEAVGRAGFLHLCGAGVVGHPDGPRAGALALRHAWESEQRVR